ncbi:MAG: CDP-alcohol phosphatidyltransferase [Oscillospiraceae bacterium]|jgi:CDP-diacylglycerol--glycerol-3-phosphate 3-phosphatidyltransferase|nr:CDP-alcohol phosphatidyltransferase [Oscillospiraceae bacterium]
MKNIPNILSLLRILCAAILLFVEPFGALFFAVYIFCGISDMLDGYIARKTKSTSAAGAVLDSIGDAVLCIVMLCILLPLMKIPITIIVWISGIAMIRVVSLGVGYYKYRKLAFLHTYLNKFTGFILFCVPLLYTFFSIPIWCILPCVIASISAVEELMMSILSRELNRDAKGIINSHIWAK